MKIFTIRNLGPIEALKQAGEASKGVRWEIFLLMLACYGVNILGMLFFGVGVLITYPMTLIAMATVYFHITDQNKKSIQPADIEL